MWWVIADQWSKRIDTSNQKRTQFEQVEKLLEVGHIQEVQFQCWQYCSCTYVFGKVENVSRFLGPNRACPKDYFPLIQINRLVD